MTILVRNHELVVEHLASIEIEQTLRREAEEQLRLLAESSPAAILTTDGKGVVLAGTSRLRCCSAFRRVRRCAGAISANICRCWRRSSAGCCQGRTAYRGEVPGLSGERRYLPGAHLVLFLLVAGGASPGGHRGGFLGKNARPRNTGTAALMRGNRMPRRRSPMVPECSSFNAEEQASRGWTPKWHAGPCATLRPEAGAKAHIPGCGCTCWRLGSDRDRRPRAPTCGALGFQFLSADAAHAWVHAYYNAFVHQQEKLSRLSGQPQHRAGQLFHVCRVGRGGAPPGGWRDVLPVRIALLRIESSGRKRPDPYTVNMWDEYNRWKREEPRGGGAWNLRRADRIAGDTAAQAAAVRDVEHRPGDPASTGRGLLRTRISAKAWNCSRVR